MLRDDKAPVPFFVQKSLCFIKTLSSGLFFKQYIQNPFFLYTSSVLSTEACDQLRAFVVSTLFSRTVFQTRKIKKYKKITEHITNTFSYLKRKWTTTTNKLRHVSNG